MTVTQILANSKKDNQTVNIINEIYIFFMHNEFKIRFPTGYKINDYYNDFIDIIVILPNGAMHFGTAYTLDNIQETMDRLNHTYFWATDFFIVKDLKIETILNTIDKSIDEGSFDMMFSVIGTINERYEGKRTYDELFDISLTLVQQFKDIDE